MSPLNLKQTYLQNSQKFPRIHASTSFREFNKFNNNIQPITNIEKTLFKKLNLQNLDNKIQPFSLKSSPRGEIIKSDRQENNKKQNNGARADSEIKINGKTTKIERCTTTLSQYQIGQQKKESMTPNRLNLKHLFKANNLQTNIKQDGTINQLKQINQKVLIEEEASEKELSNSPSLIKETSYS